MTHGGFFARIVGMCFGLIVFGRRHCGVTADAFSKQTIAFHVASLIPFGNLALNANPNWTQWAWQVQVTMNVVLALWGAQATGLLGKYFPFTTFRRLIAHIRLTFILFHSGRAVDSR